MSSRRRALALDVQYKHIQRVTPLASGANMIEVVSAEALASALNIVDGAVEVLTAMPSTVQFHDVVIHGVSMEEDL